MANDKFNLGLLGLAIGGIAAISAALDTDSSSSATPYPPVTPRTPSIRTPYDRSVSYNPYTGRTTEQTQRRVDPRSYEVRPAFQPDLAMQWLEKNGSIVKSIIRNVGYIDDGQMMEIANRAVRMVPNEQLFIYHHGGRLFMVSSEVLKSDRNAKEQLKAFFDSNPMMHVSVIRKYSTFWKYDWHYANLALHMSCIF